MLTRCPSCGTTFRLQPEQLAQAEGRVLCGKCNAAFSAIEHRIDAESTDAPFMAPMPAETDSPPPLPASTAHFRSLGQRKRFVAQAEPTSGESAGSGEARASGLDGPDDLTPPAGPQDGPAATAAPNPALIAESPTEPPPESPTEPFPELPIEPLPERPPVAPIEPDAIPDSGATPQTAEPAPAAGTDGAALEVARDEAAQDAVPEIEIEREPAGLDDRPERDEEAQVSDYLAGAAPARSWPWALGTALLGAALLVQLGFAYRTELAKNRPAWRPALEAACERLGCTVELPRDAERVSIESSDLNPESDKKHLQLAATLKNRADYPQSYPHLELTLTDVRNQPLVRRVFAPGEYLAKDAPPSFGPNAELAIKLMLEIDEVNASGYRVYLFYP